MSKLSPAEFNARLESDEPSPLVLDIRPEDEYDEWHIPGSKNVAIYEELKGDPEAVTADLSELPAGRDIVTVCAAGVASKKATRRLRELGYDAYTLEDGMRGWSRVHRSNAIETSLSGTLVQVTRPGKGCLSYVLIAHGEGVVFDPSRYSSVYENLIEAHDATLVGVYDTHAHADHVSGGQRLADRNDVTYHLHPADAIHTTATPIHDAQEFSVGPVNVEVIHTPGHSPGGVTYAVSDVALLTGDTLFHESVGRVELGVEAGLEETDVEANAEALYESLQRLTTRDGDPLVLPAHDPGTPDPPVAARLSEVRARNPDLQRSREAFVAALSSDVPDHPPNFERVKRVNVGAEEVPAEELADLELGPNRCAAD